jgi:CRISPR-associated protein Cmr2
MKFVLALSIGPVAHFIAAGRRSRDLWYGSTWLSKTTIHVAEFLGKQGGVEPLAPSQSRLEYIHDEKTQQHGARVSNKILALVTVNEGDAQKRLSELATQCRTVAREFLIARLNEIPGKIKEITPGASILHRGALEDQIKAIHNGDFIEFSAAWVPAPDGDPFFGKAVARAMQLRDATPKLFVHPSFSKAGVARSDLDEGRDSVLVPVKRDDPLQLRQARAKLGLIESEELDAIGLLRRLSPRLENAELDELPFPPVTRIAVDAWLEGCARSKKTAAILEKLRDVVHRAQREQGENFFIWCTPSGEPGQTEKRFPYEASMLLENGADALLEFVKKTLGAEDSWSSSNKTLQSANEQEPWRTIKPTLQHVNAHVRDLHKIAGLPIPYYALIEMDGDGIGEYLKASENTLEYQKRVAELDTFAAKAVDVVQQYGTAFYVAADELAAYVPLDKALDVVKDVAARFASSVPGKTISAGIVFAHARDDLRGVRKAAHDALEDAKKARKEKDVKTGYVCLREMPRSGSNRETIGAMDDVHDKMDHLVQAIGNGRISLRTEQHLREHKERFENVKTTDTIPPGVQLAQDAVRKQFTRSGDESGDDPLEKRVDALKTWKDVELLANELRIASRIADVRAQREGRHE